MTIYHIFTQHGCVFAHYETTESQRLSALVLHRTKSRWAKPTHFHIQCEAAKLHIWCYFHRRPYVNTVNRTGDDINSGSVYSIPKKIKIYRVTRNVNSSFWLWFIPISSVKSSGLVYRIYITLSSHHISAIQIHWIGLPSNMQ